MKDSSAIHEIPKITMKRFPAKDAIESARDFNKVNFSLCIDISNPRDVEIFVQLKKFDFGDGFGLITPVIQRNLKMHSSQGVFICLLESDSPIFTMSPFEDDLLRDNYSSESTSKSNPPRDIKLSTWRFTPNHNVAEIEIPIDIKNALSAEKIPSVIEVPMLMVVRSSGENVEASRADIPIRLLFPVI